MVTNNLSKTAMHHIDTANLSYDAIAIEQNKDVTMDFVVQGTSLQITKLFCSYSDKMIWYNTMLKNCRPYVTPSLHKAIFQSFNEILHSLLR